MVITGKTIDGNLVVSDILKYTDTYGLPLEYVLHKLDHANIKVDYYKFIIECLIQGWNINTIRIKLKYAILDVFGNKVGNEMLIKVNILLTFFEKEINNVYYSRESSIHSTEC